jgi:hypothetical protein
VPEGLKINQMYCRRVSKASCLQLLIGSWLLNNPSGTFYPGTFYLEPAGTF